MTDALEVCNIIFTSVFALEMMLKITAFGPYGYIKDAYNLFDGVIVIVRYTTEFCSSQKCFSQASICTAVLSTLVHSSEKNKCSKLSAGWVGSWDYLLTHTSTITVLRE
jgi:hypothetical protein